MDAAFQYRSSELKGKYWAQDKHGVISWEVVNEAMTLVEIFKGERLVRGEKRVKD